jgi:quercetin dioxygenase-like cupin family protein
MFAARGEKRTVVREMSIDSQPGDPRLLRERRNGGSCGPYGPMQAYGRLDDALTCPGDVVGSLAHPVVPGIGRTTLFTQSVDILVPMMGHFESTAVFTHLREQATHKMTTTHPPPLTVVRPGEGATGELGSIGVDFKLWGHDTGGEVSVVEHPFPVGALVPPHLHTREDEYSIVTQGEIGFRSGDREVVLGAGGYITKPRGEIHAMWNAGRVPARMIEIITPAGFEHFFRELSDLIAAGPPAPGQVPALAAEFGLEFGEPDWLPEIISRYDLTPLR